MAFERTESRGAGGGGGFGAAANLYLNSRAPPQGFDPSGGGDEGVGKSFPGRDEQVSPSVARRDHERRKKIGRRVRRKVRDQEGEKRARERVFLDLLTQSFGL